MESKIIDTIRTIRKKREYTLEDMKRKTGMTSSKIQRIENGNTKLTISDAEKLLSAIGYKIRIERVLEG